MSKKINAAALFAAAVAATAGLVSLPAPVQAKVAPVSLPELTPVPASALPGGDGLLDIVLDAVNSLPSVGDKLVLAEAFDGKHVGTYAVVSVGDAGVKLGKVGAKGGVLVKGGFTAAAHLLTGKATGVTYLYPVSIAA